MTLTELRSLEEPIAAVEPDALPFALVGRAAAYNAAVDAFRDAVRHALEDVQSGLVMDTVQADALRSCALALMTARAWLTELARLPSAARVL